MSEQTINSDTNVSGVTYQSVNAQAFIVQIGTQEITSSAVIIAGEPNVKLYMVE